MSLRATTYRLSGTAISTALYVRHQMQDIVRGMKGRTMNRDGPAMEGDRLGGPRSGPGKASRLGLHVTDEELSIWRERSIEGPYRTKGDAIPNSPGDWERISRHAHQFMENPQVDRWEGPTHGSGCIKNSTNWPRDRSGLPPRMGGPERMRDAAFYAMVSAPSNTPEIVEQVRRQLLWHSEQPGLDFTDESRWCPERFGRGFLPSLQVRGYHPAFQISVWLRKLLYGFEYSLIAHPAGWSGAEQTQFLDWIEAAARWYLPQIETHRVGMWKSNGWPTRSAHGWGGPRARPIWSGGPVTRRIQHRYNNHVNRYAVFVTDAGILTGNEDMKECGRRWIREFLKVCVYPQGGISDFYRWDDPRKGHLQGWKYGAMMVGATTIIADHLARTGDYSGYRFGTTVGTRDTSGEVPHDNVTQGGPKTLLTSARQVARYVDVDSEPQRFACFSCSDPERLINTRDPVFGIYRAEDWFLLQGNVFHRDPYLKAIFMRSLPGTPGLPAQPEHSLGWVENGDAGTFPGVNFMFGQMDGQVWPYPTTGVVADHDDSPSAANAPGSARS